MPRTHMICSVRYEIRDVFEKRAYDLVSITLRIKLKSAFFKKNHEIINYSTLRTLRDGY